MKAPHKSCGCKVKHDEEDDDEDEDDEEEKVQSNLKQSNCAKKNDKMGSGSCSVATPPLTEEPPVVTPVKNADGTVSVSVGSYESFNRYDNTQTTFNFPTLGDYENSALGNRYKSRRHSRMGKNKRDEDSSDSDRSRSRSKDRVGNVGQANTKPSCGCGKK